MDSGKIRILGSSIDTLRMHQIWPGRNDTKMSFYLMFLLSCLVFSPIWFMEFDHAFWVIKENIGQQISEDLSVGGSLIGSLFIVANFVFHQKYVGTLLASLSDFDAFGKPDDFDVMNKRLDLYSKFNSYYCGSGILMYALLTTFHYYCTKEGNGRICVFFIPIKAPFQVDNFPVKQLIYAYQVAAVLFAMKGAGNVSFTTIEIAEHIVLRIKHFKKMLQQVFDDPSRKVCERRLKMCIKYHQHLIEISKMLDFCYYYCNGFYIIFLGFIFGCLANQIVTGYSIEGIIHFIGWLISFYVRCYAGQSILSESLTISSAAFQSNWNEVDVDLRRDLSFLIMRSQKPFVMHAGPIGITSFVLFVKLLRTSYSYFTLINQTTL